MRQKFVIHTLGITEIKTLLTKGEGLTIRLKSKCFAIVLLMNLTSEYKDDRFPTCFKTFSIRWAKTSLRNAAKQTGKRIGNINEIY